MSNPEETTSRSGAATLERAAVATDALAAMRRTANPSAPFPQQASWARRLKNKLPDVHDLRPLRLAVLGNGTLDHFVEILILWLALEGFRAEIHLAPYNAFRQEILDPQSALYIFRPDIIWLFATARDIGNYQVPLGARTSECEAM